MNNSKNDKLSPKKDANSSIVPSKRAAGSVGSKEWLEVMRQKEDMTGKTLVKDEKTGLLENKSKKGIKATQKMRFLELFASDDFTFTEACNAVGTSKSMIYSHITVDPLFRQMYIEIDEAHTDKVEQMLRTQAKSNKMASAERIFYLKKKRPQIYADRPDTVTEKREDTVLKALVEKLDNYQLIPKASIVEVENDNGNQSVPEK